jgi:coniferyl-aldehyde dehydrogenase
LLSAGGMTVNGTLVHAAQPQMPVGGVGESGMGAYQGRSGFEAMSHRMPVSELSRLDAMRLIEPPYGWLASTILKLLSR